MTTKTAVSHNNYRLWLLLILLTAVFLRLYAISDVPPGLTHDEADHGLTAWKIVKGMRGIYFTIGYGREPFYDYATASLMSFLGPHYLAARLTAVYFSLFLIVGMTAWVRTAFDRSTALLTAAGLAVGFWPVMAGRQALRSIALPALFVFVATLFWRGADRLTSNDSRLKAKVQSPNLYFLIAGLCLGTTFYTYIPSRVMWLIFPTLLGFTAWRQRPFLQRVWRGTGVMLLVTFIVALPLMIYLQAHPDVEVRIRELSTPLTAVSEGNAAPLLQNTIASLRLFTVEGDSTWRYNLPGRPFLGPVVGGLFYLGIGLALWRTIRGHDLPARANFTALAWLITGLSPVLVTGPELSMTQAMGMQPVLYLFPALALAAAVKFLKGRGAGGQRGNGETGSPLLLRASAPLLILLIVVLYTTTAVITYRDYFGTWANAPEVRVQYESTMVSAISYLNKYGHGATAISTITPGQYHSPALAQMTLRNEAVSLRWFDAQYSLLLPAAETSTIIIPGFTPIPPTLASYFDTAVLIESLPLRPTDADRPLDVYRVDGTALRDIWLADFNSEAGPVSFDEAAVFMGYDLLTPIVEPGAAVQLATLWQIKRPLDGAIIFTHLLDPTGRPFAQADRLDVPGETWQSGDWFIQLHEFTLPADTAVGNYPLSIGIYTCPSGAPCPDGRRLITDAGKDNFILTTLSIAE